MFSDYCQVLLLKEYHLNETGGSQEDARSWREFESLARQGSNSQPKTQVQKPNLGTLRLFLMRAENDGKLSEGHARVRGKVQEWKKQHMFKNQTQRWGTPTGKDKFKAVSQGDGVPPANQLFRDIYYEYLKLAET